MAQLPVSPAQTPPGPLAFWAFVGSVSREPWSVNAPLSPEVAPAGRADALWQAVLQDTVLTLSLL